MKVITEKFRLRFGSERSVFLICMGIALIFWVFVKLSKTYETSRTILLEFKLPAGKQFVEAPPKNIRATFSGTGWNLMTSFLFRRKPTLEFDLSTRQAADFQREELISKIQEIVSLKVADISNNYFSISLDTTASRKVPVVANLELNFADDHFLKDSIRVVPDSILISGPVTLLEFVKFVKTKKMAVTDLNSDLRQNVEVETPGDGQLNVEPKKVEMLIPVEQYTEKSFPVQVQLAGNSDSIRIFPSTVEVTYAVGMSRYDQVTPEDFTIQADFQRGQFHPNQNTVPLVLKNQPEWVRNVQITPKSVEFFIVQ